LPSYANALMESSEVAPRQISKIKAVGYRPEIDGLRAFAVVAVIVNHFNKYILPGGYLGVDIFFVISDYVITSSLYGRSSIDFKDFISGFYERRVKRLIPALSVFVLIMSIVICLFNPAPARSLETGLASIFGLSNIYLLNQSTDYFAQSTALNVFTHTWSLGVEEQFYMVFPLLIWFSGFGRQTKNGSRNLFLIVGSLTIASLLLFLYLYPSNMSAAYFLMPSRLWEMAAGCLVFLGFQRRVSNERFIQKVPPVLLVASILGVMFLPKSMASASTVAVVVLTSVLIVALKNQTALYKLLTNDRVVYIGLISYSLYLWHWGVLSISRWTIGIHWWSVPFQVGLMLGLAVASHRWIETPLRTGSWFGKRWKTLAVGGGVLLTLTGGLIALGKPLKDRFYLGNNCKPFHYNTCTSVDSPHVSTTPFIGNTAIQRERCFLYKGAITESIIQKCTIPPKAAKLNSIFVIGSSYAHSYSPAIEALHNEFGIGVVMSVVPGCDFDPLLKTTNRRKTCKNSNETRVKNFIDNARVGDILFTGPTGLGVDKSSVNAIAELGRALKVKIVYFAPIPHWKRLDDEANNSCYEPRQWFNKGSRLDCSRYSEIDRIMHEAETGLSLEYLSKIEESNPYFHLYRIDNVICSELLCPSHIKDVRLYRDNLGHLSIHAVNRFIAQDLRSFLTNRNLLVTHH